MSRATPRCECPCGCDGRGRKGRRGFEDDALCRYCHRALRADQRRTWRALKRRTA